MSISLMLFFGLINLGTIDRLIDNVAYIEYTNKHNEIEYITIVFDNLDCVKEGKNVYFNKNKIIECFN